MLIVGVAFSASFGLTLNSLIVFVGFVPTMFAPAQRIIDAYTYYKSIVPNVASTYELLDTKPSILERPDAVKVDEVRGNIVFEDVVFGYGERQKVLDGLSFSIREGETVATGRSDRVGQVDDLQPPAAVPGSRARPDRPRRSRHQGSVRSTRCASRYPSSRSSRSS